MDGRHLGNLVINRVLESHTPFDPQWFFPHSTQEQWDAHADWLVPTKAFDPVSRKIVFPIQSYVVQTSHHNILIDTCVGNDKSRPYLPEWDCRHDATYMTALNAHGLSPADIDFVMCTHLHPDHVGWNTRLENGQWVPTFPNARYIFSAEELKVWESEHQKRPNQALVDSVSPVIAAGQAELVLNDYAVDDEVWLESSPGHSPDHVSIRLASNGHDAVVTGDMIHSPIQCVHPEWIVKPDWNKELGVRTRREFLERYADTSTFVCTMHFPLPSVGRIVSDGAAFRFVYEDTAW
jgi:glyoxylase-like metal-dependent hydrolase (beta-lactamase superfamily II)